MTAKAIILITLAIAGIILIVNSIKVGIKQEREDQKRWQRMMDRMFKAAEKKQKEDYFKIY